MRLLITFISFIAVGLLSMYPGVAKSVFALEITDHSGTRHQFDKPFRRIISLYAAHTDNLAEMGAADTLIGISASDTYADSVINKEHFSHRDTAEKFIAARPDCILIRPMIKNSTPNLIKKLQEFGITIISLQPTSVSELYDYWNMLGLISGHQNEAEDMSLIFQQKLEVLKQKVGNIQHSMRPRVYFESIHSRMKTFSPDSITMFSLESAGGVNIAENAIPRRNTNIAGYSKEKILSHAENIDVYLAQYGRMNRVSIEQIFNESGFGAIKAIRNKRVYIVEENLVSRPTTRLIDGMWHIHRLLFQEAPQ